MLSTHEIMEHISYLYSCRDFFFYHRGVRPCIIVVQEPSPLAFSITTDVILAQFSENVYKNACRRSCVRLHAPFHQHPTVTFQSEATTLNGVVFLCVVVLIFHTELLLRIKIIFFME